MWGSVSLTLVAFQPLIILMHTNGKQIDGYLLLEKEDDRARLQGRKHQVSVCVCVCVCLSVCEREWG